MSDQNFSAIRARLRYETIEDFVEGYSRFISAGGMFIPMKPSKLKPVGTTIRFQFLLGDGSTALLGEGLVLQVRSPDEQTPQSPVGMLIKFSKLSQESKSLVDRVLETKGDSLKSPTTGSEERRHPTKPSLEDEMKTPTPPSFGAAENAALAEYLMRGEDPSEAKEEVAEENVVEESAPDEDSQDEDSKDEDSQDEDSQDEDSQDEEFQDEDDRTLESEAEDFLSAPETIIESETAEDPALEVESPTAEAPQEVEEAEQVSQPVMTGPKELGRTAGGAQILAFDKLGEDDLRDLEAFSFDGADADIDDMFEGLFGGGGDASASVDNLFGGITASSKPTTGDSMSSVEFELPTPEELEDAPEENASGMFAAEDFGFVPEAKPVSAADQSDEVFSLADLNSPETRVGDSYELGELQEKSEQEWTMGALHSSDEESAGSEVLLDGDDFDEVSESEAAFHATPVVPMIPEAPAHEIHSLLNTFEDEEEEEMTLHIGLAEESKATAVNADAQDEDSLEALLASARREMEEKSNEEPREPGDIIDQLLGDDLLPPPMDGSVFNMPVAPKKKKGFLSKFFDKD